MEHMAISTSSLPPPPRVPRPTLPVQSPAAGPRAPSVEDRKKAIPARAPARGPPKRPAEGCGGRQRRGDPAARTPQPPASFPRPGPAPEKKEPLQGLPRCHSPKETEGRSETRRTGPRLAGATDAQPGTAAPGTTRKDSPPTRKQPRAPQKEKAQRAPAAITLASTPPAPIYSPLRTPRDLPSLAPARSPTSDVTQPQAGRARPAG